MSDNLTLKQQRDRFLAFSFASADLFLEINPDNSINFSLGAVKGLLGIDESNIKQKNWLDLFEKSERPILKTFISQARPVKRCGPILVNLDQSVSNGKKVIVTGIRMPDSEQFYLTIGLGNMTMAKIGQETKARQETQVLDKAHFLEAASEALNAAKSLGQDVDVTLLDIQGAKEAREELGEEAWGNLMSDINNLLLSNSVEGGMAAEIADGRFSILHDQNVNAEILQEQIKHLAEEQGEHAHLLDVKSKTVSADLESLSERDISKALLYTMNEFERKGADLTIENLNSGFKTYLAANASKIKEFQNLVGRLNFNLHFQPIVNLQTLEASHYEMLCRFDHGDTFEWIMFGEDIGMASEFDIAVCDRAMKYISYKSAGSNTIFSINISGQSIQSDEFFQKLTQLTDEHKNISKRVMFEITESSHIQDLEKAGDFIKKLRDKGFHVALDDFGAGSASFQYLQELEVDYLKIDGKYIRNLLTSQKNYAMIKNLTQMAKDLGIKVVAEFLEDEEQLEALRELGVDYGQGYLLGKPEPKPSYVRPERLKAID